MKEYLQITIEGKVQGVFFRHYTKDSATENHITGYVRNREDGTVFIECVGEKNDMKKFLAFCYKGSPTAKVTKVRVAKISKIHSFKSFDIY